MIKKMILLLNSNFLVVNDLFFTRVRDRARRRAHAKARRFVCGCPLKSVCVGQLQTNRNAQKGVL